MFHLYKKCWRKRDDSSVMDEFFKKNADGSTTLILRQNLPPSDSMLLPDLILVREAYHGLTAKLKDMSKRHDWGHDSDVPLAAVILGHVGSGRYSISSIQWGHQSLLIWSEFRKNFVPLRSTSLKTTGRTAYNFSLWGQRTPCRIHRRWVPHTFARRSGTRPNWEIQCGDLGSRGPEEAPTL
jgi:hypothetical protein